MVVVLESALKTVLDPVGVRLTVHGVVLGNSRFPKHHTTKHGVALVRSDQSIGLIWFEVVCRVCPVGTGRKSQIELNSRIL